jgi:hypothetical protein
MQILQTETIKYYTFVKDGIILLGDAGHLLETG